MFHLAKQENKMKRRLALGITAITVLVGGLAFSYTQYHGELGSKADPKEVFLNEAITQFLTRSHYEPMEINDDFSKRVYDLYLESLDLNKRYLFAADVEKLEAYQDKIDDEFNNRSFEFFDISSDLIQTRLLETQKYFTTFLSQPFDLTVKEQIETDPEKLDFPANPQEMEEIWRKTLKFQVLARVAGNLEMQKQAAEKSDTVTIKPVEQLEKEAREAILETYNDWYDRVKQIDRDDRLAVYLNAVISAYDPHSSYMPPRDQERFQVYMAGKYEGIGATLQQKQGYLVVVDMFPGSPSWRSKEVEIGDLIMKVAQGDEEAVDILDMKMDDAVALIKGPKGTTVRLTLKKRDGSFEEISLIRDVIIMEETYASSLLMEDPNTKTKVGYIYLPKFYIDFSDEQGRRCSDDVLAEIIKLKSEGAEGLIVDLRNNGGGSLPEVVKMAGLFFDKGPVVQVKTREGRPMILDDKDSRVQYTDPLVVMTNYSSASASEIFAAAIQDYQRGVIIGSPHTFGKGTVQRVIDIDDYIPAKMADQKPFGALSLTIQKFYRINGTTTQLKGVVPDIVLPDSYQYLEIGEKEQPYALPWDEIDQAGFSNWKPGYSLPDLVKKSQRRIESDDNFKLIAKNAQRLKEDSDQDVFPLQLKEYMSYLDKQEKEAEQFENLFKEKTGINLFATEADKKLFPSDTAKSERTTRMIEDLSKDFYLAEAFKVMEDILKK